MNETNSTTPRISIITPSFNQGQYIEQNIQSVLNQDYPNFEHIIIDGGSTDNTLQILAKYPHLIWVSEKDNGQADALNKGLAKATGNIIGWQNADDYYSDNIFTEVIRVFQNNTTRWIIGNVNYLYDDKSVILPIKSPKITYERLLKTPNIVKQQGSFFAKSLMQQAGGFNSSFYMVMDYDLWLRMAKIEKPLMIDQYWTYYRHHENQKTYGFKHVHIQIKEINEILKRENVSLYFRTKRKIVQRLRLVVSKFLLSTKKILIYTHMIDKKYENSSLILKKISKIKLR
ncbi:MAG: glycosyltransferase [Planctomycetes bacterium]|nr:glycosyltransferase [Planctomycetota bacterium]